MLNEAMNNVASRHSAFIILYLVYWLMTKVYVMVPCCSSGASGSALKIERLAASHRFHWAEPEDLALFQEQCNQIFSSYRGTKCKTLDITISSNAWETTRYITHIYLAVVFRTFQKRAIIEIDVNPRA